MVVSATVSELLSAGHSFHRDFCCTLLARWAVNLVCAITYLIVVTTYLVVVACSGVTEGVHNTYQAYFWHNILYQWSTSITK